MVENLTQENQENKEGSHPVKEVSSESRLLLIFVSIFIISIIALLSLMLKSPLTPEKESFYTAKHYQSFNAKLSEIKLANLKQKNIERSFSPEEVASFLREIFTKKEVSNLKGERYIAFPSPIILELKNQNFQLFLNLRIYTLNLVLGVKGKINLQERRLLTITLERLSLGKLAFPGAIIQNILKSFNIIIAYPMPHFLKAVYLENSLLKLGSKAKHETKSKPQKTERPPALTSSRRQTLEQKSQSSTKKATAKAKKVYSQEEKAKKLHQTGDYFFTKKRYDFALKYYKKLANECPDYSKIKIIKKRIDILSEAKNVK